MSSQDKLIQIRSRKLGVLMLDARMVKRRTVEECAEVVCVPVDRYQTYESGAMAPSLPELEALAYYLDIPLEHFWGSSTLTEKAAAVPKQTERLLKLRHRLVGTYLRMGRTKANLTFKELSEATGLPEDQLKSFELGEQPVSVPQLELLARALSMRIEEFFDQNGPIGKWRYDQNAIQQFLDLPAELQQFVCKPVNRPYLELAMRLSELSVEKLRGVAEGLLEITY